MYLTHVGFYDLGSGRLRPLSEKPRSATYAMVFSPGERLLAVGGQDQRVTLYEWLTGREVATLSAHRGPVSALAFDPTGPRLAAGSHDTTIVVWDFAGLERRRKAGTDKPLEKEAMDGLWKNLAAEDAAKGYEAVWTLRSRPKEAIPFLRDHLMPEPNGDWLRRFQSLVRDLDAEKFDTREKASMELEKLGEAAEPLLHRAAAEGASAELRRRVTAIEEAVAKGLPESERRRRSRALEVLETLEAAEARELLRSLAEKGPGAWLREEAAAALARKRDKPTGP